MVQLLDRITGPADLKNLSFQELEQLAAEIRQQIITVVSKNGGHLASNLGAVELTIALHRVFNSPQDKIIWDVGHQAYAHKLLTGRKDRFSTLRQYEGLSGFTSRTESEHDPFGAGHASTSISAALGMAIARDFKGNDNHVIAVIGDGAVTGGMALEALNHAGHMGIRLIVVLNDNGMSISPTVGALARVLSNIRLNYYYSQAKERGKRILSSIPLGNQLRQAGQHLESGVKGLFMPTVLWEELGFTYIGPINGHDQRDVENALAQARNYRQKPILVHVVTTKGKGYQPAEGDAVYFHGLSAKKTSPKTVPSYSEIFAQTALRIIREDPRVVVITPAMPEGYSLNIVQAEFPERVFDVGICEQHAVTLAAGMATEGYRPIVAIYSTFLQRAYDQIIHDVCLQDLPVIFALDRSGFVGDDGKTHQGTFDISYLGSIPNLVVSAPKDENELQHLIYTAIRLEHPMAVRYPRGIATGIALDAELQLIPIGSSELLREGSDVAIVALGNTVIPAINASKELASKGINATLVNARFAKPLDSQMLLNLANVTKHIITVEENTLNGGFGSRCNQVFQDSGLKEIEVKNLGIPDEFIEHGTQSILRAKYKLDTGGIVETVLAMLPTNYLSTNANRRAGVGS